MSAIPSSSSSNSAQSLPVSTGSVRIKRGTPVPAAQTITTATVDAAAAVVTTVATSVDSTVQNALTSASSSSRRKRAKQSSSTDSASPAPAAAPTPNNKDLLSMLASSKPAPAVSSAPASVSPPQDLGFSQPGPFSSTAQSIQTFVARQPTVKAESSPTSKKSKAKKRVESDSESSSSSSSSGSSKSSSSSSSSGSSKSSSSSSSSGSSKSSSSSSSSGSSKSSSSSSSSGSESSSVEEAPKKGKKAAQKAAQEKAALDAQYAKYSGFNNDLKNTLIQQYLSFDVEYIQPDLQSTMQAAFSSLDREVTKAQIELFGGRLFVIQATFNGVAPKDLGVQVKEGKGKWSDRVVVKIVPNRTTLESTLVFAVKNGLQVTDGKKAHNVELKFSIPKGTGSNATRNDIPQTNKPFKLDMRSHGFQVGAKIQGIEF